MKVNMRKWYSFLIALFAVMMLFTPITCKAEENTTFNSVEEAKEYISQQEELAGSAGENIAEAEQYIKEKTVPMYATIWALVPPLIAIGLALITKEVYFSLFVGILTGALFYSNFNLEKTIHTVFVSGMISKLSDVGNVGILIFLVILGIMVSLMNKVGGSAAYGKWAGQKIKSRRGAMLSTFGLGALIFVDDYFNCLTVGSVMRPISIR